MSAEKNKESNFLRYLLFFIIGVFTYPAINIINRLSVKGMERLKKLPSRNVLFVSNHQTYFMDVIIFNHIFGAAKCGKKKGLGFPLYLIRPFIKVRYVAATLTMQSNMLTKIFTLAGGITVKRTWSNSSGEVQKGLDIGDTRNITRALENNWVITFPQGTTTPYAPGRKGTSFIIKQSKPIVVPIVIDGFSKAFSQKKMGLQKWGTRLNVNIKEPLEIDFEASTEAILAQIMDAIEQSEHFQKQ